MKRMFCVGGAGSKKQEAGSRATGIGYQVSGIRPYFGGHMMENKDSITLNKLYIFTFIL